ncbi:DUF7289 family protein [Haloglomus salinum]|uniref:DUF7289 family protein n=1 Tax=Haloglomus salinum TaxID=2962673 RepID=UPI0020C9D184|nr:hypothetical protein [Haloglomus salinum]
MNGRPSRGQATIGFALIVGIALIGVVTVVALGATALTDIQTSSGTGAAEQAMTQFDSKTSQVALGDSNTQTVSVGQTAGSYQVDPDAGYVQVVHIDYDGNWQDDGDNLPNSAPPGDEDEEVIYESTLGTVRYQRGDTTIGYQSGGVWKRTGQGQSTMVSPPEFHYRGSTLTFPVVRVNQLGGGTQSGSGAIDLRVQQSDEPRSVFPNQSVAYPDTNGKSNGVYSNPSENGTVVVYIESEYYQAWANYFEDRTDGRIQTSDTGGSLLNGYPADPNGDGETGQLVAVELVSTGRTGAFNMPGDGSALEVSGVADHSMSSFDITLTPDKADSANFNNLQWSMYADDGGQEFEMHVRKDGGGGKCDTQEFAVRIFYSPAGTDKYHGWEEDGITGNCVDADGEDGADEIELSLTFVDDDDGDDLPREDNGDENDMQLEYTSLSNNALIHFDASGRSLKSNPTFDQHGDTQGDADPVTWEPVSYSTGDEESSDGLVNHYFSLLGPGFDLTVDDSNNNGVQESASAGNIQYTGGDEFITYVHLSENDVEVTVD